MSCSLPVSVREVDEKLTEGETPEITIDQTWICCVDQDDAMRVIVFAHLYFPRFSPVSCGQAEQPLGDGLNFLIGDPGA